MQVEVVLENGGLAARVRVPAFQPDRWKAEFPDPASFRQAMLRKGILPEFLDEAALGTIHGLLTIADGSDSARSLEQAQAMVVATGLEPGREEVEGLMFHRSYLSSPEELESLKSRLLSEPFEAFEKSLDPACLVDNGATILSYRSLTPGNPGRDVFGAAIPLQPRHRSLPLAGPSILDRELKWTARKKGVLVLEENVLKVWGPGNGEGDCLWIAPDRMRVHLVLKKGVEDDFKLTLPMLKDAIAGRRFAFGVPEEKLRSALRAFQEQGREQDEPIVHGKPCEPGKDGRLELLVDPEPRLPDAGDSDRVDYKAFTFFRTVAKGHPLARILPPAPGKVGMDVFGQAILPEPTRPFEKPLGKNTEASGSDPSLVVAACDGKLAMVDGMPEVVGTLTINDDVSLKTGNIEFPGSVDVNGDLRDNLGISAKGDVDIAGAVEDGTILCEGAVVVRGGFTGTGKGVIKSKLSSVTIGFIRNQRIESHSNIVVYNEVVNAHLSARKSILMKTLDHSVVGGYLLAYQSIEISNVGSSMGIKTILEVGKDFEVEAELTRRGEELKVLAADLEFLERMLFKLQSMVRLGSEVKGETRLLEQRTKGVVQYLRQAKEGLAAEIRSLESRLLNPGECVIWVRGDVFPGTVLKYHDRTIFIRENMKGKRWVFKGGMPPAPELPAPARIPPAAASRPSKPPPRG